MSATVGSLNVDLSIGTARFKKGLDEAQAKLASTQKKFEAFGNGMQSIGARMSVGITAPFAALMAKAIPAARESREALGQVNAALASMGPVAGRTSAQLQDAAKSLQHLSLYDDDDIMRKVTANLLTFGNVAGQQFDRAQAAAVDLAARMQMDLQPATLIIGKALNEPVKGISALSRAGIQFTEQQKEQIKTMTAAGNVAGAQKIMLAELERQFKGSAQAMRDADPTAALNNSWSDFQEVVGEVALKVLPPLTKALESFLTRFNNLSPGMQTTAVAVAATAAAAGPMLAAFGGLVNIAAPLLASFGAGGTATVAMSGLAPILGPLAIAVGAVTLAWKNWDKIGPYIDGVVERTTKGTADINAHLASIQKAADAFDKRMGTPTKDEFITKASKDFDAFWKEINSYDLAAWARGVDTQAMQVWESFKRLHARAQASVKAMVDGISAELTGRLGSAWATLKRMTTAAGDYFYNMWDRVVGHSYVPDMVDEIGRQMARLDGNMVNVAKAATDKAGQAFKDMQEAVRPILERLFPDEVKANAFRTELATLERDMKRLGFTAEQTAEAIDRLYAERRGETPGEARAPVTIDPGTDTVPVFGPGGVGSLPDPMGNVATSSAEKLRAILVAIGESGQGSIGEIARAIGTILMPSFEQAGGAVQSLQDKMGQLAGAITSIFSEVFGKKTGGILGQVVNVGLQVYGATKGGSFGGARAEGGPVSFGKSYLVGERGPELFMPKLAGTIIPNSALQSASQNRGSVMKVVVEASPYFDARVVDVASPHISAMGVRAANGGANMAMGQFVRQQRQNLGR